MNQGLYYNNSYGNQIYQTFNQPLSMNVNRQMPPNLFPSNPVN
jgi:hypothetical protein